MTCREKFMIEHPEASWFEFYTLLRCPSDYGYLDDPSFCLSDPSFCLDDGGRRCDRCWDREIPETDGQLAESKYQTICDRCKSSGVCKYSDDLNTFMHDVHNRFPFVTPGFRCEYFNDRKVDM
mgnify:CR=1 FL=1